MYHLICLLPLIAIAQIDLAQTIERRPMGDADFNKPPAFGEALEAAKAFTLPRGLEINVFAAEPQLVSPVAISTDHKAALSVVERFPPWANAGMTMASSIPGRAEALPAQPAKTAAPWATARP